MNPLHFAQRRRARGEIDHFMGRAIRRDEEPLLTLTDTLDALRIFKAVERAARSGRRQSLMYA